MIILVDEEGVPINLLSYKDPDVEPRSASVFLMFPEEEWENELEYQNALIEQDVPF
jgi:hypothetical protein